MTSIEFLCTDCAMWAANRDDSGAGTNWDAREAASQYIVLVGETDNVWDFSSEPCAACGSTLAGVRFEAFKA